MRNILLAGLILLAACSSEPAAPTVVVVKDTVTVSVPTPPDTVIVVDSFPVPTPPDTVFLPPPMGNWTMMPIGLGELRNGIPLYNHIGLPAASVMTDGSDFSYGDWSRVGGDKGVQFNVAPLPVNPPDRTKGQLIFRARHTNGGGFITMKFTLEPLGYFGYYYHDGNGSYFMSSDWRWYVYNYTGNLNLPDYTNIGAVFIGNAPGFSYQPIQISEWYINASGN